MKPMFAGRRRSGAVDSQLVGVGAIEKRQVMI